MPQLIITEGALQGLERCRHFLKDKAPEAEQRAAQAISEKLLMLETNPHAGRPLDDAPDLREIIVEFGDTGYIGLYRFEPGENAVYLLAFRHQKEAGY